MSALRPTPLVTTVIIEGGLGLLALALGMLIGHSPASTLRIGWAAFALGVGAAIPMLALFSVFWHASLPPVDRLRRELTPILTRLFAESSAPALALVALAAGFGEELLFRGLIQGGLEQYFHAPGAALCLASAIFGLAHPLSPTYVVLATGLGFYLGWLWMATGNLLVPVLAHAVYDFGALLVLLRKGTNESRGQETA